VYYISPQVWAWKEARVKKIRKVVDKMLVILPFEKAFFEDKWNYKVEFVGHPLAQVVQEYKATHQPQSFGLKPIIALLPGSRKQEIKIKLPIMLEAVHAFPQYQFIVAKATSLDDAFYEPFLQGFPEVRTVRGQTYALLAQAAAALVTSGTATLETALFGVPQVVCYKGSPISYAIAKRLITIKYISLVNLIMDKPVVTELIQHQLTAPNIIRELEALLQQQPRRAQMLAAYGQLQRLLQQNGNASERAAAIIFAFVQAAA
jgi:lipid-A-disaccharide synthase